jgi:hypothetical protein
MTRVRRVFARVPTRLLLGSLFAGLSLLACDPSLFSPSPSSVCTESGVQCQLAKGPLGVCERSPCSASDLAPCFQCTPQH